MTRSEERKIRIRNRRLLTRRYEGYSITELARRFGLTPSAIRAVLSEIDPLYGCEIPKQLVHRQLKKWLSNEKKAEITNLLGHTPNPNELSRNYGISRVLALSVASLLRNEREKFLEKQKRDKMKELEVSREKAKRMYEAGASKRFISRRFGFSRKELSRLLVDESRG